MQRLWIEPHARRQASPIGETVVMQANGAERSLSRFEVELASLPSACLYLRYNVDVEVAEDKTVIVHKLHKIEPLPVLWKHVTKEGKLESAAGAVEKRKRPTKRRGVKKPGPNEPVKNADHIPPAIRGCFEVALQSDANFYELLILYPDHVLLKLTDSQRANIAAVKDTTLSHLWESLRANVDATLPPQGALRSRLSSGNEACDLYEMIWDVYVAKGTTWFRDLTDNTAIQTLRQWNVMTSSNSLVSVVYEENMLLEAAKRASGLEVHIFRSWHKDFMSFALQLASREGARIFAADEQARSDSMSCGLYDVAHWHTAAYGTPGAGAVVILRAERLTTKELTQICRNVGTSKLVLMGDADLLLMIPERQSTLHAFALLAKENAATLHAWPVDMWQAPLYREIVAGATARTEVGILQKWSALKGIIPQKLRQHSAILCFTEKDRHLAMDALSTHGNILSDAPRANTSYSIPSLGFVGRIKRISPPPPKQPATVEFEPIPGTNTDGPTVDASEVRRVYVECLSRYVGTRHDLVLVLIHDDTPRDQVAAALKYAIKTFRVFFVPESKQRRFDSLPATSDFYRSERVH